MKTLYRATFSPQLYVQRTGRALRVVPTLAPVIDEVRADVVDAVLDAHMIQRLVDNYGASKRDIANAFGPSSRLGRCGPCKVLTTSADWSAL